MFRLLRTEGIKYIYLQCIDLNCLQARFSSLEFSRILTRNKVECESIHDDARAATNVFQLPATRVEGRFIGVWRRPSHGQ